MAESTDDSVRREKNTKTDLVGLFILPDWRPFSPPDWSVCLAITAQSARASFQFSVVDLEGDATLIKEVSIYVGLSGVYMNLECEVEHLIQLTERRCNVKSTLYSPKTCFSKLTTTCGLAKHILKKPPVHPYWHTVTFQNIRKKEYQHKYLNWRWVQLMRWQQFSKSLVSNLLAECRNRINISCKSCSPK